MRMFIYKSLIFLDVMVMVTLKKLFSTCLFLLFRNVILRKSSLLKCLYTVNKGEICIVLQMYIHETATNIKIRIFPSPLKKLPYASCTQFYPLFSLWQPLFLFLSLYFFPRRSYKWHRWILKQLCWVLKKQTKIVYMVYNILENEK